MSELVESRRYFKSSDKSTPLISEITSDISTTVSNVFPVIAACNKLN